MTIAHLPGRVVVIARTTQDGYDWPNGHHDEQCWPADKHQPAAPYFREQMAEGLQRFTPEDWRRAEAAIDEHYRQRKT